MFWAGQWRARRGKRAAYLLAFWIARRAFSGLGVAFCAACVFYYVNWGADLACDKFKVEHGKIMRGCKFGCGVAAYLLLPVREDKIPLHLGSHVSFLYASPSEKVLNEI